MATIGVRMPPLMDTSSAASSLGAIFGNAIGGPTPLQQLQIDKFKKGMAEMDARKALINEQTGLAHQKMLDEQRQLNEGNAAFAAQRAAGTAAGNAAALHVGPAPALVWSDYDRRKALWDADVAKARADATATYLAPGNAAQRADAINSLTGGNLAQFGNPDAMRRGATLMGHNPGINDYFGAGDTAPLANAQADLISKPPSPVIVNGKPYDAVGPVGERELKPLAGTPEMPYGTGDKADVYKSLEDQRVAAGEDPTAVRRDLLEKATQGSQVSRESDSARRDRIVAEANDAIRSGDPKRIAAVNPDIYAQAYQQNNYGPKDDIRLDNGQLVRVTTNSPVPNLISPEELYRLRGMGRAGAPAPSAPPPEQGGPFAPPPASPIIDMSRAPIPVGGSSERTSVTPIGAVRPPSLNGEERKSLATAETLIRPAAYFDKMSPAQIPSGIKPLIAAAASGAPVTMAMISNYVQDPESRAYAQMALNYLNPKLRLDSGATILPAEYAAKWMTDVPMPGDQDQDLLDKKVNRARTIKAAIGGLPEAALGGYNDIVKQEGYDPNFYAPPAQPGQRAAGPALPKLEIGQTHDVGGGMSIRRNK